MKKYWNKRLGVVIVLLIVAVTPLLFQKPEQITRTEADEVLVVITPHNATIRSEFAYAFNRYWQKKTGKKVYIDWRTPGGSSEVRMVLDAKFQRVGENEGVGIDVFFGGGEYFFEQMAQQGRFVTLDIFKKHKQWFEGREGIPQHYTGETYYSKDHLWMGVCLSQLGICYNVNTLKRLGIDPPRSWDDLGEPAFFGVIAMADPTKSGSVTKAFEMLIQQKIHTRIAELKREPGETERQRRQRAIRYGWADGLNLIQRIAANARYFTDVATKIPRDVAQGDAAAGMCIDFYGRVYHEKLLQSDGSSRLQWIAPEKGSSLTVDPVAVFRGAPNGELAQGFVEFLLSEQGQVLWNKKRGAVNGPVYRVLRRLPVRPSVYTAENLADFTDPEVMPYRGEPDFVYQGEITGPAFESLRYIIKNICIDPHEELQEAWKALIDQGLPKRALAHFHDVSYVSYVKAIGGIREQVRSEKKIETVAVAKRMTSVFRRNYRETVSLAREEGGQQ